VTANTDVSITVTNAGTTVHDLTFEGVDIKSGYLQPGESTTITVNLPPGSYTFYCTIPGHRPAGMVGTLIVE
jgi:uncharacterized cupredoxin-like copper-binding protein